MKRTATLSKWVQAATTIFGIAGVDWRRWVGDTYETAYELLTFREQMQLRQN